MVPPMKRYSNGIVRAEFKELMKFVKASRENADVFQSGANGRLRLFFEDDAPDYTHFLAFDGAKITGVYCIREKHELSGEIISVDPKHRNQGIAMRLVRSVFSYAVEKNAVFATGGYTPAGRQLLARSLPRIHHAEFPTLRIRWVGDQEGASIDGTKPYKLTYRLGSNLPVPEFI